MPIVRHELPRWLRAAPKAGVRGLAAALCILAVFAAGVAGNRLPQDEPWAALLVYRETALAVVLLLGSALLTAFSGVFGQWVERHERAAQERHLVLAYLNERATAWDRSEWGREVPSIVARRLSVSSVDDHAEAAQRAFSEEEALAGRRLLVVLGGPGSGKTWLARRYARRAAQAAQHALTSGARLSQVEVPVYTTWDRWINLTAGNGEGVRAGLIASSFDPDIAHGGDETAEDMVAMKEILNRRGTRLVVVIDSLDEASGRDHAGRLGNLARLASTGVRVVVTSRPGAWDVVKSALPRDDGTRLIVELQDLTYPEDVDAFVNAWFEGDAQRAHAVVQQLRERPDIARAATVPLLLTFYCLVAAEGEPNEPLPARRHSLYERLIAQSLGRANRGQGLDPDHRLHKHADLLRRWAWEAVGASNTPAGLGNWGETFVPATPPTTEDTRALDALAPKIGVVTGRTMRRFQHRTILEHLVAEYVATLPTDEAFGLLLPHLWFDPDWEVAAPAAVAAHNRIWPAQLVERLLELLESFSGKPSSEGDANQAASHALVRIVLRAAADSEPGEWREDHRATISDLRTDSLAWAPGLAAATVHWRNRADEEVSRVLELLTTADDADLVGQLAKALPGLTLDDTARAQAFDTILDRVTTTQNGALAWRMVEALPGLTLDDAARAQAFDTVLHLVTTTEDSFLTGWLAAVLEGLAVDDAARAHAFDTVLHGIKIAGAINKAARLAMALPGLATNDVARTNALDAVLHIATTTDDDSMAGELVQLLPRLAVDNTARAHAFHVVLRRATSTGNAFMAGVLAEALPGLAVDDAARILAFETILRRVATAPTGFVTEWLADVLPGMAVDDTARARAFDTLLHHAATSAEGFQAGYLVVVVAGLAVDDEGRVRAFDTVLHHAATADDDKVVGRMAEALSGLAVDDAARARAFDTVLRRTTTADSDFAAGLLAEALPGLAVDDAARARAFDTVLRRTTTADSDFAAGLLTWALEGLAVDDASRARAFETVLHRAITTDHPFYARQQAETLPSLGVRPDVVRQAIETHTGTTQVRQELAAPFRAVLPYDQWLRLLRTGHI